MGIVMAYLDQRRIARSPGTLIAVAALEAAVIYGVVTGLIVKIRPPEVVPPPSTFDVPLEKPAPLPKENPKPHDPVPIERKPQQLAPVPHQDLFKPGAIIIAPGPIATPSPEPAADLFPRPSPSPTLGFKPRLAQPRNSPAGWATTEDYPGSDLRQGNQGLVRFSLTVGADGNVSACVVTASSGFPGLDAATCDKVSRRARFEPATDASGAKVTGSYAGSVRWVIPD